MPVGLWQVPWAGAPMAGASVVVVLAGAVAGDGAVVIAAVGAGACVVAVEPAGAVDGLGDGAGAWTGTEVVAEVGAEVAGV